MDSDDEISNHAVLYEQEDSDEEFIGDAAISEDEASEKYPYQVLSIEEVVHYMLEFIKEVNSVVEIPATTTRILLNHFRWDKQQLMEKYYEGDQDKLFAKARVVNPFKQKPDFNSECTTEHCGICFMSVPTTKVASLECGHRFCVDCWDSYLTTKIMEQGDVEKLSCVAHKCDILMDDVSVMKLIKNSKVKLKYQQLITNSFVEFNEFLRWCSNAKCNNVIKVLSIEPKPVTCRCNSTFCFACGESWHEPVTCEMLRKWLKQIQDEDETRVWMEKNTKECPQCMTSIEKNGGCNLVYCTKCQNQFCWVCCCRVGDWGHHCRFTDSQRKSEAVAERYLFHYYRYTTHQKSLKLEVQLYDKAKEKILEMQPLGISCIEGQFLKRAVDILCSCRMTLMYTYVFSFYLRRTNQTMIFESNQKDLEHSVEVLSRYLERDINDQDLMKIRQQVQDKYRYCENRRKKLLEHVQDGNEKDFWDYINQ